MPIPGIALRRRRASFLMQLVTRQALAPIGRYPEPRRWSGRAATGRLSSSLAANRIGVTARIAGGDVASAALPPRWRIAWPRPDIKKAKTQTVYQSEDDNFGPRPLGNCLLIQDLAGANDDDQPNRDEYHRGRRRVARERPEHARDYSSPLLRGQHTVGLARQVGESPRTSHLLAGGTTLAARCHAPTKQELAVEDRLRVRWCG